MYGLWDRFSLGAMKYLIILFLRYCNEVEFCNSTRYANKLVEKWQRKCLNVGRSVLKSVPFAYSGHPAQIAVLSYNLSNFPLRNVSKTAKKSFKKTCSFK